ncbi:glycosyltransferase [Lactococcus formosensis subsp. bovis]|uniref:glycosyltransferase family 2 protein n=1 Tax=Lactococcus formosensis TaxID=1281486 RepID=UPI0002FFCF2A
MVGWFNLSSIVDVMLFIFIFYPIVGGIFWIIGGTYYQFRTKNRLPKFPEGTKEPFITIMVPCHNEEVVIERTLYYLDTQINYKNYEIIAISDGSTDNTNAILRNWQEAKPDSHLRVIEVQKNKGKAHGLTQAALHSKGDFLLCIDADSFVTGDALKHMVAWFMKDSIFSPKELVAAVTGNPMPRNLTSLLAKLQYVEYHSIIGMTKRAQSMIGRIFTVSGVCVMYRREALIDIGLFDQSKITEDIAVSWALQLKGWRIQYAPNARCYMEVPEKISVLYKQRRRWAQGGLEVFMSHALDVLLHPVKTFPFIFLLMDQFLSIMWAIFWFISSLFVIYWLFFWVALGDGFQIRRFMISALIFIMYEFIVGVTQLLTSIWFNDSDKAAMKYSLFAGWYTWIYWLISPFTLLAALPRAIKAQITGGGGTWVSPERQKTGD